MINTIQAIEHLKKDPVLSGVIVKFGVIEYPVPDSLFESLAGSIIGQQLSNKAADTIWQRFIQLFPDKKVTPEQITNVSSESIRQVGTSWAKVNSLKDLSNKVLNGVIQLDKLSEMPDEEVINHLVLVKGIGRWTAEMRLMFSLARPDILPLEDVGIQNAFVKLYGLNRSHKTFTKKMMKIAENWKPYRTVACYYLWRFLDNK